LEYVLGNNVRIVSAEEAGNSMVSGFNRMVRLRTSIHLNGVLTAFLMYLFSWLTFWSELPAGAFFIKWVLGMSKLRTASNMNKLFLENINIKATEFKGFIIFGWFLPCPVTAYLWNICLGLT
jgi:hypothetical protein